MFIGNIYIGWACLGLLTILLVKSSKSFAETISTAQLWDTGKLTFGFCMIWGYFFFSQFLPQWYGNLPEETQWMILRTREFPWKGLGWLTFFMCFVIPFVLLISEDIKRAPKFLVPVLLCILCGVWLEKFMIIMPELSPDRIPYSFPEIVLQLALFLGFASIYVLCLRWFLSRFPFLPVSHPMTHGSRDW